MQSRTAMAFGLALTLAGLAGVWMITQPAPRGRPAVMREQASVPAQAGIAAARRIGADPATAHNPAGQPLPDWRGMRDRLASAPNLRAFYYEAMRRPSEGGYYYGLSVASACRSVVENQKNGAPERQQRAADSLRARCDFSLQELDAADREWMAMRNFHVADDPLLSRMVAAAQANDADSMALVLSGAIDEGNADMIGVLVAGSIELRIRKTINPDPQTASDYAQYATVLLRCRLGEDCGAQSMETAALCAVRGWCADTMQDALRIGLGKDFDAVDRLAAQAATDIRARNLRRLLSAS